MLGIHTAVEAETEKIFRIVVTFFKNQNYWHKICKFLKQQQKQSNAIIMWYNWQIGVTNTYSALMPQIFTHRTSKCHFWGLQTTRFKEFLSILKNSSAF